MRSKAYPLTTSLVGILGLAWHLAAATGTADRLKIFPEAITLTGPNAHQQLLVQATRDQQVQEEVTQDVRWSLSANDVLELNGNRLQPLGNGTVTLTAEIGSQRTSIPVKVEGYDTPSKRTFRNHVQPILAKFGCSAGACHGAAAGKNGFKLSLRGYDDAGDFTALTRHALGRRIIPADPGRSLLLTKPTGSVPHKGGARFAVESPEYNVIAQWIAGGFPGPSETDVRIVRIETIPPQVNLQPGQQQQVLVRAHFDDGHYEDVTRWAKFSSANESVVRVNEEGSVEVLGHGEGAVTAWYLSRIATSTITAPYQGEASSPQLVSDRNLIDREVAAKLRQLNIPASPRSQDSQFLRRAFLDTLGILPNVEEVKTFLAETRADKRSHLIDTLLERPEFIDYWTYQWSDLLLVQSKQLGTPAMWAYYRWIREQVAQNTPWDEFVRAIVTARGSNLNNGAANFFVLHDDPKLMAETTTQAFLGMSINCAKCHNHPLEKWTNDQYFQMANLFARVRTKTGPGNSEDIVFTALNGEVVQPLTGKPQTPTPLDGSPVASEDTADRREHLADWLVSPENPYFSRAIANRIWANFMGVGLVEKVDDLRVTNPASNEALLSALGTYLVENDFDIKSLIRLILQSDTYQRSSEASEANANDDRFYSRYYPRRLMAEVMLDAFSQVTAVPTAFSGFPDGWRALQLPDSNIESYFLSSFGRADRAQTCVCERTDEPSVAQVLHIANGKTLNDKLQTQDNRIGLALTRQTPLVEIVDELYLAALSRYPTERERDRIQTLLAETPQAEHRQALEDVYWAVLSSREFLFSH